MLLAFMFGTTFLLIMIVFAVLVKNPSPIEFTAFMVTISLSAAGIGAAIPGLLEVRFKRILRAGGAIALFVIVWFYQPSIVNTVVNFEPPKEDARQAAKRFLDIFTSDDIQSIYSSLDPVSQPKLDISMLSELHTNVMEPLGMVEQRNLINSQVSQSPPGYPIGIYASFSYRTRFSSLNECRREIIILRSAEEQQWKVHTYNVGLQNIPCT